jgi:hypothetical protein
MEVSLQIEKLDEGKLVELPIKTDWGPGKIMKVDGKYAYIRFKNDPKTEPKKYSVYDNPLVLASNQSDPVLERMRMVSKNRPDKGVKQQAPIMSFEKAREIFAAKYPGKFDDPNYIGDPKNGERFYKLKAAELYQELFGNGQLRQMLDDKEAGKLAERAQKIFQAQNLTFVQEILRFKDVLNDPGSSLQYFGALSKLLDSAEVTAETLIPYFETIKSIAVAGFAKWPNATLFPFLAQPNRFIFLKPQVTKNFASKLGYDLKYEATPNAVTYEAFLRMAADCKVKLADWEPKDNIDIQSFIWLLDSIMKDPLKKREPLNESK